jgi:xanthine dehydrogenase molybdenum-binding subunit
MADDKLDMPNEPLEHDKFIPEEFKCLGRRGQKRIDGYRKASGKAIYTKDIILPGMLYARFLTSPYPNAKILEMDTSKAEKLIGVRAVLRYDDLEVKGKKALSAYGGEEFILADHAYFQGQQVGAVVAADTEDIADEALKLIKVKWQERPFVLDAEKALQPDAPQVRPELGYETNRIETPPPFILGDLDKGFQEADRVIEFEARRRFYGCPDAELLNGITKWDGEYPELWVHHQHPYEFKWTVHQWFGTPMSHVRVQAPYSGAMFGAFCWIDYSMIPQCVSAILARRTGQPVKWVFNRRDDFYSGNLDDMVAHFKVGFTENCIITAVKIKTIFANYCIDAQPHTHLIDNTRIPNIYSETIGARVNRGPVGPYRCEQTPAAAVLIHVFNHVAAELGVDPTELALKNDGVEGKDMMYLTEFKRTHGFPTRDSLRECIEAGKKAIGWSKKWHPPGAKKLANGKMHGMGFIWDHEWDDNRGAGMAGILIQQDGSVNIIALRTDIGVNAETTYCQVVAEELGMRIEDVFFRNQDDVYMPLMTPDGSCNLTTNGYVVRKASRIAKKRLLELATSEVHLIESIIPPAFPNFKPEDLDIQSSEIFVKADPSIRKKVAEVTKDIADASVTYGLEYAAIQTTTHAPVFAWAYHRQGRYGVEVGRHRLCRQAHFCEIEVDSETGEIEVKKIVNVNDVGKALSPESVEGQQYGGTYMGVSRNRNEQFIWDKPTGVLLNGNLIDYKIALSSDIGDVETIIIETGMGYGPYGSVGVAEDNATLGTYLLEGAVYNAIGKWIDDGPITAEKVLKALGKV